MAETEEERPIPPEAETEEDPKPKEIETIESPLKIESWEDVFNAMCIIRGVDPKQVQSMAKFSNFDNNDERAFYKNQFTFVAIAQLRMYGQAFYKGQDWNEYELAADLLAVSSMGYKGFKSEQYKDTVSGQPNLDKLKGLPEETQKGILSGLFNRGKKE